MAKAFAQLAQLSQHFGERQRLALGVLIAAVCGYELRQYTILFRDAALYELVPGGLLFVLKFLKGATPVIQ